MQSEEPIPYFDPAEEIFHIWAGCPIAEKAYKRQDGFPGTRTLCSSCKDWRDKRLPHLNPSPAETDLRKSE